MSDSEYSVVKRDVIKSVDCSMQLSFDQFMFRNQSCLKALKEINYSKTEDIMLK